MEVAALASIMNLALPALFLVLVAIFVYFAFTLVHHWGYYGFNANFKRIAQWTYLSVSSLILLALGLFIGIYLF
jgi:hypothetical protein